MLVRPSANTVGDKPDHRVVRSARIDWVSIGYIETIQRGRSLASTGRTTHGGSSSISGQAGQFAIRSTTI
jgi:hypothetical protein